MVFRMMKDQFLYLQHHGILMMAYLSSLLLVIVELKLLKLGIVLPVLLLEMVLQM